MFSVELAVIVFIAAFTQAVLGFGFGLIFVALGCLLFPAKEIIPLSFFMGLFMDAMLVVSTYKYRPKKKILELVVMGILGAPIGVMMFFKLNAAIFEPILGVFLFLAVVILYLKKLSIPHNQLTRSVSGFITGVLGALFGVAGPFISIFLLSDRSLSRKQNIFVMNIYFVGITFVAFMAYIFKGAYSDLGVIHGGILLLITVLGSVVGLSFGHRLSKNWYRYCVYALIIFSAVFLVFP